MMRAWRLDGATSTLLLGLDAEGVPAILHWGARLAAGIDAVEPFARRGPRTNGLDADVPSAQLYPGAGSGRFGRPALSAHRGGRHPFVDLSFAADMAPGRLTLQGEDRICGLAVRIELVLPGDGDVLAMRAELDNRGDDALTVDHMAAGQFLAPADAAELTSFRGSWGREFASERSTLTHGMWQQENRRGRTSHDRWPTFFLSGPSGAWGFHLGWSGNSRLLAERLDDGRVLVQLGELFESGEAILAPGRSIATPWAYAAYGVSVDGAARAFREHVRRRILGDLGPRPVIMNTWEGSYFAHDIAALKRQAELAADLGVERFVLDDGWFGRRDDDRSSLGDWRVDRRKYPEGLDPLIGHVRGLGMEFGLWIEPEMISPDSDLYRAHPDWALAVRGRPARTGRNQLVLDLTRPEARAHLQESLDRLLRQHAISYLKWDMNRDLCDAEDGAGQAAYRRQTLAVYDMMAALRAAHPGVEIESCASGGGRADLGVLRHARRIWVSDCTDALERLRMQRGALSLFPPAVLGAHVSSSPNHQTGRRHSLAFRALAALPFHFGIELDPRSLEAAEFAELKAWVALHKRLRPLFHGGNLTAAPPEEGRSLLAVVSSDRSDAVVIVAQETLGLGERAPRLRVPGLDRERSYAIAAPPPQRPADLPLPAATWTQLAAGAALPGSLLAEVGLPLANMRPETAFLLTLTARERSALHHG